MADGRCRGCGGQLPIGARFCPSCGVGIDEVPVLPLLDADEPPSEVEAGGEGRRARATRTVLALAAGVVVLLLGLSAVAGGGDGDGDEDAGDDATDERADDDGGPSRSTSTTRPRPSTTTTTTVPMLLTEGGAPEAAGAVAMHVWGEQLVVADLGTGRQIIVPGPTGIGEVRQLAVRGTHLLAMGTTTSAHALDLERGGTWSPVEGLAMGLAVGSVSDGSVVHVDDSTVGAIEPDGELTVWTLPRSLYAWGVLGRIGDEVVLNTGDGVFLFDRAGNARRVSQGSAIGTNGQVVLVQTCDDSFTCGLATIDAGGAIVSTLPQIPDGIAVDGATVSPDGRSVIIGGVHIGGTGQYESFRSDGASWATAGTSGAWSLSQATWTSASGTAAWPSGEGNEIHVVPAAGEPLDLRIHSRATFFFGSVAVTTLDALPEAWRAALAG